MQFIDESTGTPIVSRVVLPNRSMVFNISNLSVADPSSTLDLTTTPLSRVAVRYDGAPGRRSDAYIFAQDLRDYRINLRDEAITSALGGHIPGPDYLGEYVKCEPRSAVRLAWDGREDDTLTTPLYVEQFWGTATPCGEASEPAGGGSVKTAVVYDRGLCGHIVENIEQQVRSATIRSWNEVSTEIYDYLDIDTIVVNRSAFRSAMYVGPQSGPDITGGLVLAAGFDVEIPVLMTSRSPLPTTSRSRSTTKASSRRPQPSSFTTSTEAGCRAIQSPTRPSRPSSPTRSRPE